MFEQAKLFIKRVFSAWSEDRVTDLSAALSYYTIFSITPLLIICIALTGFFLGDEAAKGKIVEQISGLVGRDTGIQIQAMIESANKPHTAIFAQVAGVIMLILGASGVFGQIQSGLNIIWGVEADPKEGWFDLIKKRFLSFSMVLGVAFLLLVSLILSALLTMVSNSISGFMGWEIIASGISYILSFIIVMVLFALIYKILPDVKVEWRNVWLGAFIASLLFDIGKFLLGFYIAKADVMSTFGAAGTLVVILIWAFYSAQILFIGAEITETSANKRTLKSEQ